jgi:two-component system, NarL family, sensor histidine kinase DesK
MTITVTNPRKIRNKWAWLWLTYTAFLFIEPLVEPSLALWLCTLAVFAAFLGVFSAFVRCSDEGKSVRIWMVAATFALGLISFPWNPGASTFFVYTAAFLPFTIVSVRRVFLGFLVEALLILGEGYLFHAHRGFLHIYWPNTFIAIFA